MIEISRNSVRKLRLSSVALWFRGPFLHLTVCMLCISGMIVIAGGSVHAWQGHVVRVLDGDTMEIRNCNDKIVRIHLYGVEAPRKSQYFGIHSAQYFAALVHDRSVHVINVGRDLLGRMRSLVWIDGLSVNEEMVRAGYAWVSNPFGLSPSCERWKGVQMAARESRTGLWDGLEVCLEQGIVPDLPKSCPKF